MACSGAYAEARDYAELVCTRTLDIQKEAMVNRQLEITAGALHAALSAGDQCDCDPEPWALNYLKHLNIILAAATQDCPCSTISNEDKAAYMLFVNQELEKIRTGQVDICGGTGKAHPAFGVAELGVNIFNRAKIIQNRMQRQGG